MMVDQCLNVYCILSLSNTFVGATVRSCSVVRSSLRQVAVLAFLTLSRASPLPTTGKLIPHEVETEEDYFVPALQPSDATDSYQIYQPQLPLDFQLPNVEQNSVPFNAPEPATFLKAPQESQEPNYYEVPIPNQELAAPLDTEWNPNNDPIMYYEVPVALTKQDLPTKEYPKKFSEDIHLKKKPLSTRPKQELVLQPIDEKQFEQRQIELQKRFELLAKNENKKVIKMLRPRTKPVEPQAAATDFINQQDNASFDEGLSSDLISSLGIPVASHEASSHGERIEFHMVGHDGPLSYKWGFDTGKGHNRQFRFEERDKEGLVKGHYGFYDKQGKLQKVHYNAHPNDGFHVESNPDNS